MEKFMRGPFIVFLLICIINTDGLCDSCSKYGCENGATCTVNSIDCSISCICPLSYTGNKCESNITDLNLNTEASNNITTEANQSDVTTQASITTTLRPFSQRTCLFGMLTCVHGYCNGQSCACDKNWTGPQCKDLDCPLSCEKSCQLYNDIVTCIEVTSTTVPSTSKDIASSNTQPTPASLKQEDVTSTIPITTTLRDISNRTCFTGVCIHGYCYIGKVIMKCVCDDHWKGRYCDELDCPSDCSYGCHIDNDKLTCSEPLIEVSTVNASTVTMDTNDVTTRSLEMRTCYPGFFVCINGFCEKSSVMFRCQCDPYWTGTFCDKLDCQNCDSDCTLVGGSIECITPVTPYSTEDTGTKISTAIPSTTTTGAVNGSYPDEHVCSDNYIANHTGDTAICILPCVNGRCKLLSSGYKCICDLGADGDLCEKKCCTICGDHGRCRVDINGTEYCNCVFNYEGEFCEQEIIPEVLEEETWYWWVVGVCLCLIVILILALVVLPYWMWRNRVILIMKIVHYFQRYEDNDDREWDAFVSYKCDDKDESFVLRQLYSKLEVEMGFKLCLHFRDFIPGDTIANNIIRAVQGSRRTILLLTPRYVHSEFTKFEYQMAQTEMLKRRHRIIPLVLEDISSHKSELDPNLEQIMNSVTYLEWPEDEDSVKIQKFWKKLVLSMPKKKDVEERRKAMSSTSSPTSYSLSSQISDIPLVNHSISIDSSSSNGVSLVLSDSNSNGYLSSEPIKNNEVILKIPDDSSDTKTNGVKPSNLENNINTYLDLIDKDSVNCSHT